MKHTPGPWVVGKDGNVYAQDFYKPAPFTDTDGREHPDFMSGLVALPYFCGGASAEANAEFIVRAVNAHRDLLAALKKARPAVDELHGQGIGCPGCRRDNPDGAPSCALIDEIDAAIAKAESK